MGAAVGAATPPVTGTLAVTIDGAPASFPSIVGAFNGVRVDVSGYTADLTRSFALSVYPDGMTSGSFTCALGGQTSMTMTYSVNFSPMAAPATAAGSWGPPPSNPDVDGRRGAIRRDLLRNGRDRRRDGAARSTSPFHPTDRVMTAAPGAEH